MITQRSTVTERHWEGEPRFDLSEEIRPELSVEVTDFFCFARVRVRSDGAAVPRHRNIDTHSPPRAADQPPRVMPRPCSPHKLLVSKGITDSPEKRRLTTFGSAGSINHPDRKAFVDAHSQRSSPSSTRHASLGDHKALEAEALAEVRRKMIRRKCFVPNPGVWIMT